ncbi:MAG: T9SS type A sorting domain-containing protein [Lewinellaceae bacterium]|nr:T9SS type A sorting domain-containing protein [Lewinellaceae bacterium]
MKTRITLFITLLWTTVSLFGQAVVINSPVEIAGGYDFEAAGFGRTITDSIWTADAVFVNDGSANPTQGCEAAVNTAELAGKIALIDRGSCEFGLKCLNAEQGGAVAAIVINNAPGNGAIVMGAGVNGGFVTIPCVMVPYEVGQLIRAALVTGSVNISLGNLVPPPPPGNDLALSNTNVIVAPLGIIPSSQIKAMGEFVFTPGAQALNRGTNSAPNMMLNATINYTAPGGTPTEVYNESTSTAAETLPDSTTSLLVLPAYDPFGTGDGTYNYTYSVTMDSTDEVSFNNQASSSFTISTNNLYSKATFDPVTGNPRVIATTTVSGGGNVEFLTILNIPHGFGFEIDSVLFEVRHTPTLANIPVEAYVYEWNDLNQDSSLNNDEIQIVAIATYTFPEDYPDDRTLLRLPFLDFITFEETGVVIPEDNKDYVIGIRYQGTETVSFGFDSSNDYTQYLNYKSANGTFTDRDYGFLGINAWTDLMPDVEAAFTFTDNLGFCSSTGILLKDLTIGTEDIVGPETFEVKMFPNPTSDVLQLNLNIKQQTSFVEYMITDMMGKELFKTRDNDVMETEQASFNVSQLPAGQYNMAIRTEQGIRASSFVVKR